MLGREPCTRDQKPPSLRQFSGHLKRMTQCVDTVEVLDHPSIFKITIENRET